MANLKDRLRNKQKELSERKTDSKIIYPKEGTIRFRVLNTGEDEEFAVEVIRVFLGKELGGIICPTSIGKPSAIYDKYKELSTSKEDADKALAKKLVGRKKFLIPVLIYQDSKGKEIDEEKSGKFLQIAGGTYNELIDLYHDEDDWGDFTDPEEGYDCKLTRKGNTQLDTEYTIAPCAKTPLPKAWRKIVDIRGMLEEIIPSYEKTEELLAKFLQEENLEEMPKSEKPKSLKPLVGKKLIKK